MIQCIFENTSNKHNGQICFNMYYYICKMNNNYNMYYIIKPNN